MGLWRAGPARGTRGDRAIWESLFAQWIIMTIGQDNIRFSSLFGPSEVICQTRETDRDKILLEMLQLLGRGRNIGNVATAYQAVLERENDLPTVVGPGMAMPHARLDGLPELAVAVATSTQGIVYDPRRPDDRIKLVVLTLAPKASPGAYLQALGCVAAICRDPATATVVAALPTADQVWSFFDRGGMSAQAPSTPAL